MSRKRAPWENSVYLTKRTYSNWFNRIYNIAITRFEWKGLPETIPEDFLERVLFWNGYAVGFKDEAIGPIVLPAVAASSYDIWGNPKLVRAYAYNGEYTVDNLNAMNSVQIWNNAGRTPDLQAVISYAERLARIDRTIDVNLDAQKCPRVAVVKENNRLSVENAIRQVDGFNPWLFINKDNDISDAFDVLDLTAPFISLELHTLKRQTWNECLSYLGVEANVSDKNERLVSAEATMNMGQIEASRYSPLVSREKFARQFNELFGTNISVEMRSNLQLSRVMREEGLDATEYNEVKM